MCIPLEGILVAEPLTLRGKGEVARTTTSTPMHHSGVMHRGVKQRTGRGIRGLEVPRVGHLATGVGRTRIGHGFLELINGMRIRGIGGTMGENVRA